MPNFITDPALDPYMIQIDESNYAVVKNVTVEKSGKTYQQTLGFFSKLGTKKIFSESIFSGISSVTTKAAPLVKASCIYWQPCDLVPCIAKKTEFLLISFEEFEI